VAYVTLQEVQQWLERTKLDLTEFDIELEASAKSFVFAKVSRFYDTSTWLAANTTPELIRKILAILVAAWTYMRQYSEDEDALNEYAEKLEKMAYDLIDGIIGGTLELSGAAAVLGGSTPATFYPTDAQDDAEGGKDGADERRRFTMGSVF
jgi:hypothetical protein